MTLKSKKYDKLNVRGIGCISALGSNIDECMINMFAGLRNAMSPSRFSTDHTIEYPVFQINENFNSQGLSRNWGNSENAKNSENSNLTLTAQFALAAVTQALGDAKIGSNELKNKRVGVCMGTTVGCALNNDQFYIDYKQGKKPGMSAIKRFLNSNPAASVAKQLNLTGPVQTVVNACASGTDAIGIGASWIKMGLCDLVIAGGTDELCKVTYNGFISLMITDTDLCKPFDKTRKGLNLGEGAAAVILEGVSESSSAACSRKCFISGYASACDAYHLTAPDPDGKGLERALTRALNESNLDMSDIGFINAHGTGTKDNDKVEDHVLAKVLPGTPYFSTKGYTGHTLGASGAIEAVFTIQHLMDGKIPGSIGFSQKDDVAKQTPVQKITTVSNRAAISQSVAFGGNNSVLVFSKI
ncbi:MAG: beta-ketoacyl-[acyl-carrier-protein] synthase family protein [Desulfobacula sp.]|nr:beta-ketoacyl-[acyl-carrier-protein] synthase family protein [Desulfobacula sp.]